MQPGILYAISCTLGSEQVDSVIPVNVKTIIASLEYFIVENEKSARQFLKSLDAGIVQQNLNIQVLDKHDEKKGIEKLLIPALEGKNMGLLSEAGLVAVADPGGLVTELAHKKNIKVVPLTGPSSIFLALMASGLNGQSFCFHGYLPKEKEQQKIKLKELENYSFKKKQTQVFIETPFRNHQLLDAILSACEPSTLLCIATDITLDSEIILTKAVAQWRKNFPDINKRPSVFLLLKK